MNDDASQQIDEYRLVSLVANTAACQIWEVEGKGSSRRQAMKLLKEDSPNFRQNKASLKHETEVGRQLQHANIIGIEKFVGGRDHCYMIMEYFRAVNVKIQLRADLVALHSRLRRLIDGICAGIAWMHDRGWVHRDFKPDNVLMNKSGEVKLIDFSLASKIVSGLGKLLSSNPKAIQGTRTYIAPETIRKQTATPQTDMYSLGITFFELLTGRPPFGATNPEDLLRMHLSNRPLAPSSLNGNVTVEMDRVVERLLRKNPQDRYRDMGELIGELRRIRFFREPVAEPEPVTSNPSLPKAPATIRTSPVGEKKTEEQGACVPEVPLRKELENTPPLLAPNLPTASVPAVPIPLPPPTTNPPPQIVWQQIPGYPYPVPVASVGGVVYGMPGFPMGGAVPYAVNPESLPTFPVPPPTGMPVTPVIPSNPLSSSPTHAKNPSIVPNLPVAPPGSVASPPNVQKPGVSHTPTEIPESIPPDQLETMTELPDVS